MIVRPYRPADAAAIAQLFYDAVHAVPDADYSAAERAAWAPAPPDAERWHRRMAMRRTLVAETSGEVAAFAELDPDGHLDMFYCRPDRQRQGIGRELYRAIEAAARNAGMDRLTVEASHAGRRFFARQGFRLLRRQSVVRDGITLVNFRMEKRLGPET